MFQTTRKIEVNIVYRWFLGYDLTKQVQTSPRFYRRLFLFVLKITE